MNARQRLLRFFYPVWNLFAKFTGKHQMHGQNKTIPPLSSVFDLSFTDVKGEFHSIEKYKGKKILFVNTASECVYTTQYSGLQKLYEKHKDVLMVIAFPSNEFKEQEKGSDAEIAEFCSLNYGLTFPVATKSLVKKKAGQNPVFNWLTSAEKNGWNEQSPAWNFSKYLVDESGMLAQVFGPPVDPLSKELIKAIDSR